MSLTTLPLHASHTPHGREVVTSYFWSGNTVPASLRSRSVSDIVLSGTLDMPAPPPKLVADWQRETSLHLDLQAGSVEALPLIRARARWPDYRHCVQAVSDWTSTLGLHGLLASCEVALMACRGARYHHDAERYGGSAFCNLFLSDDKGLDLHFPWTGQRIPLTKGTAVVFDTGQPHGVIARHNAAFDVADFPPDRDCTQVFLTWELPVENVHLAHALQIALDVDPSTALLLLGEEQVWLNGARAELCTDTGQWSRATNPAMQI
jgi:hypothetical protein